MNKVLSMLQSREWDRVIRAGIEAAEGKMPEDGSYLRQHGKIFMMADGSKEFHWKGRLVAKQWPPKL